MRWYGIMIGLGAFLIIGMLHPVVIKAEYYCSKKVWPVFLVSGIGCNAVSLLVDHLVVSILFAVLGFSLFWSIGELFEQEKRVKKGWFPDNPRKGAIWDSSGITPKKVLHLLAGFVFLGIGLVGIVLPVLPTTPFLLVSVYCFSKGSVFFHQWFCNTSIYKKYLEGYIKDKAMSWKEKLSILFFATAVMGIALIKIDFWPVRGSLIAVMLIHWWYFLFRIKTK